MKSYKELYDELIAKAKKNREVILQSYHEDHHIIPRSIRPDLINESKNIVALTAADHFRAHYYLWKYYKHETTEKSYARKMCYAFQMMKRLIVKSENIEMLAKLYEEVKKDFAIYNSEMYKGKPKSEEQKKKMSIAHKGKHHSEEARKKMSIAKSGENHPNFGKHLSAETKKKISEKEKGKHLSEEHIQKMSKKVRQYTKNGEFVAEYSSTQEAARKTGIAQSNISECCNGHRKSAGGFIWKYATDISSL